MFTEIKLYLYGTVAFAVILLGLCCIHLKSQSKVLKNSLNQATLSLRHQSNQVNALLKQRDGLQKIDDQHTKALTNATQTIRNLGAQLNVGQRQLYIKNAVIHKLSHASSTSSLGYATACRLNKAGQQDYLTLLKLIARQKEQILYLQDYAKAVSG